MPDPATRGSLYPRDGKNCIFRSWGTPLKKQIWGRYFSYEEAGMSMWSREVAVFESQSDKPELPYGS